MAQLIHLVYASVASQRFSAQQLTELLRQSRAANERIGVTGMLLYADGSFFQVLEGPPEIVDRLAARIHSDPRHTNMIVIIREPIARRSFEEWSMGFAHLSPAEIAQVAGTNDFFEQRSCLTRMNAGRAQKLLTAFAKGRWHAKLTGPVPAGV
ncbi:MAG: BLUF domain-containing protein [Acidobacteriota bacterium]